MSEAHAEGPSCPLPRQDAECVTLAHGGGGALMQGLVREVFAGAFGNDARHDGARVDTSGLPVVTTTDAFVVKPLFFPGGDIGALAVHGTLNDLAMCGARPRALTVAFVIEEGFALAELRRIAASMAAAARAADVAIVSGDTKVVERGHGDGVYITTAGIGVLEHAQDIHPRAIAPGDAVLLSGDIGRHGTAVMLAREGLRSDTPLTSDQQNLWPAVEALLEHGIEVHCLRDLTRGGLATALVELARDSGWGMDLEEAAISVTPAVAALCELFGLDPLYVANEGRFVAVVPAAQTADALAALRRAGAAATLLGEVSTRRDGRVRLRTRYGTTRHVALLSGAQLPRIC